MKNKIFWVILNLFIFWAVSDLFSGIVLQQGVVGFLVCGGIFGVAMIGVIPLIRFFTLPVKFITLFLISIMLSVIVFFVFYLAVPFVDFTDGELVGFSNEYFELPQINLSMMANVLLGGFVCGTISSFLNWLDWTD